MEPSTAWAMFYATIVGIRFHPKNHDELVDLEHYARIADDMTNIYTRRYPCHSEALSSTQASRPRDPPHKQTHNPEPTAPTSNSNASNKPGNR